MLCDVRKETSRLTRIAFVLAVETNNKDLLSFVNAIIERNSSKLFIALSLAGIDETEFTVPLEYGGVECRFRV